MDLELTSDGKCPCNCGNPFVCQDAIKNASDETGTASVMGQATVEEPEKDAHEILAPLAMGSVQKLPREAISISPSFPIHAGQENAESHQNTLPPETFDVDAKMFLVWCNSYGQNILVDGHHHFRDAQVATHFVTSKFQKDRLVSCEPELLCRVIYERDGWTLDLVKVLSQRANFEGKKAISLTPEEQTATDSLLGTDFSVYIDCLATDGRSVTVLSRDSKNNEMKVRQRASRVDSLNHNGRVYPRNVANKAVALADEWARSGLMTSELEHPVVVSDCSKGRCEPKFAHNPKRQTAVVNRIFPADADGWIDIERTIKGNTPCGKIVMDAINSGRPIGISTRFHVRGKIKDWEGQKVMVADAMDICTFDDVENPAVDGAGMPSPVTDSCLSFLTGDSVTYSGLPEGTELPQDPYLGTPFFGVNNNTVNPSLDQEPELDQDSRRLTRALEDSHMYDIPRLIADFKANYGKPGASSINYVADGCKIVHAIKDAQDKGQCVKDSLAEFKTAFDSSTMAGYRGGAIAVTVASEMGGEVGAGWGSEIETATGLNKLVHSAGMTKPEPHGEDGKRMGSTPDGDARLKALLDEMDEEDAKKKMKGDFKKAADECEDLKEDEPMKDSLWKVAKKICKPGTDMKAFIEGQLKFVKKVGATDKTAVDKANAILAQAQGQQGQTITGKSSTGDTQLSGKGAKVVSEFRPWAAGTAKYLEATDAMCRKNRGALISGIDVADPDNIETKKRRQHNAQYIAPILEDHAMKRMALARDNSDFKLATDSAQDQMRILQDSVKPLLSVDPRMSPAVDTTTTAVVLNQPSIQEGQIVVGFQDLTALEFIMAMGPRGFNAATRTAGFEPNVSMPFGTNLRIPSINYENPVGYGYSDGFFDAGLQVPQNVGIAPGNVSVSWLNFGVTSRKLSCILTWEAIKQIGNGPGDISLLSWELYMMKARESRTIDNYLYNEMVNVAYEFNAVAVSAESYTTVNNLLVNNSQYNPGNAVVVNLNPSKKANAAVASGDMSVTYPAAPPAGTQAIVAAVRLLAGGANTNAAPFYGFYNGAGYPGTIGPGPIVRPRTVPTLSNAAGNTTNVTSNPVTITGTLNTAVQGELTSTGGIWSYPNTTATFAVDYENGTVVFAAGAVIGAANAVTTSVTITYSYATNWADFVADPVLAAANNLIPTGQNSQQYQSLLMSTVDTVAAAMGSSANYVKPDAAISNLIGSSFYTPAQIFAPLFSPPATELFPSPSAVAERSGITFHRHNSSWVGRSQTLLLTRKGSTFYAQDTPFQIMGPVTVQDAAGNPTGNLAFYGQEFSVIGTRQPIDLNGNVVNCPNKVIILRMLKQQIGVF